MQPQKYLQLMLTLSFGLLGNAWSGDPSADLKNYSLSLQDEFPEVRTISTSTLAAQKEKPLLLDVRSEKEFAVSHLPGAIRAEKDIPAQLQKLALSKGTPIVVYCAVGYRSAVAAQKLSAAGFENVQNLEGSIFAWTNEGRDLVNAKGPTKSTHPYNRRWGRFLKKSKWQWKPGTN